MHRRSRKTPITFRVTSADVIHGMLITGTNINSMVSPGYVSTFKTTFDKPGDHLMPCHEFCGVGHEGMWANVKVVEPDAFAKLVGPPREPAVIYNKRLILAHFWLAFGLFAVAILLGEWQMFIP